MDREAPDRGSASHTGMWFGPRPGSLVFLAPFLGARRPRAAPGQARLSLPAIVEPSATLTGARARSPVGRTLPPGKGRARMILQPVLC